MHLSIPDANVNAALAVIRSHGLTVIRVGDSTEGTTDVEVPSVAPDELPSLMAELTAQPDADNPDAIGAVVV